jgi:hypothetical protein
MFTEVHSIRRQHINLCTYRSLNLFYIVITLYNIYIYICINTFEIHSTKYGHEGAHKNEMVIKC